MMSYLSLQRLSIGVRMVKQTHVGNFIVNRRASDLGSSIIGPLSQYTDVEVSKNPEEWKYVERLLPKQTVPVPTPKESYASGWVPPRIEEAIKNPYFIPRTKNHMPPIYLKTYFRGMKKVTKILHIQGDIWALNDDLTKYLKKKMNTDRVASQVHELCCQIKFKGDFVAHTLEWAKEKGF